MNETRAQAATLIGKVFLHYLDNLAESGAMLEIWLRVLDVLDRLMNSGQQHQLQLQQGVRGGGGAANLDGGLLEEQIPESLKNCLLVMAEAGYLVRPAKVKPDPDADAEEAAGNQEDEERDLRTWEETKRRIDRFLPGLFASVFPELPPPAAEKENMAQQDTEARRQSARTGT